MADISETIQQPLEEASKSSINAFVALFVAITATFMAICNVKDGNIVQAMDQAQAHSIDSWSYYQCQKHQTSYSGKRSRTGQTPKISRHRRPDKKYEAQIARYDSEKAAIKKQAEDYQKQYDDLNLFDDQFDMTEALLTISIAMFGIASLTQRKWLLWFASGMSLLGIIFGITAFFKVSLHSDFVSGILS
ncbi:DUF4337 domain-containing protein [Puia sp. P3]|uniref:DUF4337 domain-containing protein n=1 Tax=Puia sp. P3 TaxID=3423952 RepID=UPI003D667E52